MLRNNMYCIVTYDVKAQRNAQILKVLRQYLFRVQNSVFEGELSPVQYKKLWSELKEVTNPEDGDVISFYSTITSASIRRKDIGYVPDNTSLVI